MKSYFIEITFSKVWRNNRRNNQKKKSSKSSNSTAHAIHQHTYPQTNKQILTYFPTNHMFSCSLYSQKHMKLEKTVLGGKTKKKT